MATMKMRSSHYAASAAFLFLATLLVVHPDVANAEPHLRGGAASLFHDDVRVNHDDLSQQSRNLLTASVGFCLADIPYDKTAIRTGETALGNLVTDAITWYMKTMKASWVPAAIFNAGGIRAGFANGVITDDQVAAALPYNNYLVVVNVKGAQVIQALENAVSNVSNIEGRFLQVSGLKFSFDASQPVGKRVLSAQIQRPNGNWVDIKKCAPVNLAINDYMLGGGDGFTMFQQASSVVPYPGDKYTEIVIAYMVSKMFINPATHDRITTCPGTAGCPVGRTVEDRCGPAPK